MDALLLAVLNALWQGAALIALVALGLRGGLRRNATTACVVWSLTFLVVALLPALDLTLARPATAAAAKAEPRNAAVPFAVRAASRSAFPSRAANAATAVARTPQRTADGPAAAVVFLTGRVRDAVLRIGGAATVFARAWGGAVAGAWALVAAVLLLRLSRAYAAIARMKRTATPLDDPAVDARLRAAGHRRRASVACSPYVAIPCAVGFRHPMILVPTALAASLDADDLARVVLHESAHLQRYDDWVNALEQIVCALQFFQPALYVARRSIDFEREVACDDRVLADAGEPLRYAECLARIVQRHVRGPRAAVVPGFVLRRAQVVARVRRIVDRSRDASPHLRLGAVVLGGGVMLATLGIARLQVPVVAAVSAMPVYDTAAATPDTPALRRMTRIPTTTVALSPTAQRVDGAPHAADPAPAHPPAGAGRPGYARRPAPPHGAVLHAQHARTPHAALPSAAHAGHAAPAAALAADAARAAVAASAPTAVAADAARDAVAESAPFAVAARAAHAAQAEGAARFAVAAANSDAVAQAAADAAARTRFAYAVAHAAGAAAPRATESGSSAPHNGGDLLDAIDAAKYPRPSVDELIALLNQGITGDYVRRMGALGRGRPTLHQLTALAVQGVTPDYIAALDRRLAGQPSLDQVIALRVQGVSTAWLDGLAAIGYQKLSADEAASLAVQGVSVAYVRGLLDAGLRTVTPGQLAALRVQGVDGTFVRRLAAHGYRNLSPDELARLKVSGFEP